MTGREWTRASGERWPRERVAGIVAAIERALEGNRYEVCGSWRRGADTCKDLDVLVWGDARAALEHVAGFVRQHCLIYVGGEEPHLVDAEVTRGGPRVANGVIAGLPVDFWGIASESEVGAMQVFATGPGKLNIVMRATAARRGLMLSQYGVFRKGTREQLDDGTEAGVFAAVGWECATPEERQARWAR